MKQLKEILESEEFKPFREEFEERRKPLGKPRKHKFENIILTEILLDSYPLNLKEPIVNNWELDSKAWIYFHLERIAEKNEIFLPFYLYMVDKVLYNCWDIRNCNGKRAQNQGKSDVWSARSYVRDAAHDLGINKPIDSLTIPEAKTVLHYMRFGVADYERNMWEELKGKKIK